jgi:hypothetical protein
MGDKTKKFDEFIEKDKEKELKKFNKDKEYEPLSDEITAIAKLDTGEYEEIKEPVNITQITGVVTDPKEIKEIEKAVKENVTLDTSLVIKDVKRGDILWLTAILEKKTKTSSWNSQVLGVVKVRVVDYFYGLNKLNTIKNINK